MPFLLAGLGTLLGNLITKIIFALGIGFISYKGADVLISHVTSYIASQTGVIPAELSEAWNALGCQIAMNMILSAYTTKLSLVGATKLVMTPKAA